LAIKRWPTVEQSTSNITFLIRMPNALREIVKN
jgi:hypothetical protein